MKRNLALLMALGLTVFVLFTATSVIQTIILPAASPSAFANPKADGKQAALVDASTISGDPSNGLPVSPVVASQIAQGAASSGAVLTGIPELVNFEGKVAYEVPFDLGKIYVDANTGEVLNNGTVTFVPAQIGPEQAASIAATYLGRDDVFRIEFMDIGGQMAYRVKFANGDAVFVDPYGQIVLVRLASNGSSSSQGESSHEGEHESGDD